MMNFEKLLALLLALIVIVGCLAACDPIEPTPEPTPDPTDETTTTAGGGDATTTPSTGGNTTPEFVDFASQLKFNPNSGKKYAEVTVHAYIDGDTTHFSINDSDFDGKVLKARYLGINTPESTGTIEPWGKKASKYTKTQLQAATSIIIESDSATWNADSTGDRYLVWVWYKTAEDEEYRNINLEILQQGLAFGSNASGNTYAEYTMGALNQAKNLKLYVFSKEKDPEFYYGGAIELSLKELKANCEKYDGKLVKFEAVVAKTIGPTFYVEEYDAENDMYFGMQIFAGYGCPIEGDFKIGNRMSIVGKVSYYENGDTYQISSLSYDVMDPTWAGGCSILETGHSASFRELDIATLMDSKIELETWVETEDENGELVEELVTREFEYGELAHYSTVSMKNLTVKSVWTTVNPESSSLGALTITCTDASGREIDIRTADKLRIEVDGETVDVTEDFFPKGTVISVKGIIDSYDGDYQIKVFAYSDITIEQ